MIDQNEKSLEELHLQEPCTFYDYLLVDENVQCAPLPNTKDIVTFILQQPGETNESDNDTADPLPAVTYFEAYSAFLKII